MGEDLRRNRHLDKQIQTKGAAGPTWGGGAIKSLRQSDVHVWEGTRVAEGNPHRFEPVDSLSVDAHHRKRV